MLHRVGIKSFHFVSILSGMFWCMQVVVSLVWILKQAEKFTCPSVFINHITIDRMRSCVRLADVYHQLVFTVSQCLQLAGVHGYYGQLVFTVSQSVWLTGVHGQLVFMVITVSQCSWLVDVNSELVFGQLVFMFS